MHTDDRAGPLGGGIDALRLCVIAKGQRLRCFVGLTSLMLVTERACVRAYQCVRVWESESESDCVCS